MAWQEIVAKILSDIYIILSAPFADFEILWILIPAYATWLGAEYFSKEQKSFGDVFISGFLAFWTGANWFRHVGFSLDVKFALTAAILLYGAVIIIESFLGKSFIKAIAGIQYVAFLIIILTPYIYDLVELEVGMLLSVATLLPFMVIIPFIIRKFINIPE